MLESRAVWGGMFACVGGHRGLFVSAGIEGVCMVGGLYHRRLVVSLTLLFVSRRSNGGGAGCRYRQDGCGSCELRYRCSSRRQWRREPVNHINQKRLILRQRRIGRFCCCNAARPRAQPDAYAVLYIPRLVVRQSRHHIRLQRRSQRPPRPPARPLALSRLHVCLFWFLRRLPRR